MPLSSERSPHTNDGKSVSLTIYMLFSALHGVEKGTLQLLLPLICFTVSYERAGVLDMVNLKSSSPHAQADLKTWSFKPAGFSMQVFIAVVIGMAFFWQFLRHANLVNLFSASFAGSVFGVEAWVPLYYGVSLLVACVALIQRVLASFNKRFVVETLSALATIAAGVFLVLRLFGGIDEGILLASGSLAVCLFALSFVALALSWADCCRRLAVLDVKGMVYCVCISSLVSLVISFGLFSLSPMPEIFPVIVPVASMLPLLYVRSSVSSASFENVERHKVRTPASLKQGMGPKSLIPVLVALLIVAVCVKGLYDTLVVNGAGTDLYLKHFITIVELAIIMTICVFAVKLEKVAFLGWFVLVGGLVSGLVMISLSDSDLFLQVGLGTITAARTCFEVFVFCLVVGALEKGVASRTVLLLLVIPESASCLLGYCLIPEILLALDLSMLPTVGFISLGLGIAVAVCSFLVAGFFALKGIDAASSADVKHEAAPRTLEPQIEEKFDRIAVEFGLTPREQEIAGYVFRGYSAKRIAELQYVSLNTVQSHTRNLYRKIGIHSRQELIDLVDMN